MPGGGGGERPLLLLALSSELEMRLLVLLMRLRMGTVVGGGLRKLVCGLIFGGFGCMTQMGSVCREVLTPEKDDLISLG